VKTVCFHIGTHKTGSTSIQRFLARADDALAQQGILYPEAGRPDTDWSDQYGQHELYWSIVGKRGIDDEQVWNELRREIDEYGGRRVVVSAEGFEGCAPEDIRRIVSHLAPHPIHVVVYLRPPVHFLRSAYKQRVKMGTYSDSFVRFVKEMIPRCNYLDLVSRWEQFDGVESVDIRLFEKVKHDPGLESSFADAVGIDFEAVQSFVGSPANTSPPDDLVRVARWINAVGTLGDESETWRTLTNRARNNVLDQRWPGTWLARAARPFLRDSFVTDRATDAVRKELEEVHERFLRTYVDCGDWIYLSL
jgi:hypothetical protein